MLWTLSICKIRNYLTNCYFPERDEKAMVEGIVAREKFLTSDIEIEKGDNFR